MNKWISIKDRFPQDGENVLALSNYGSHSQGNMNIMSVIYFDNRWEVDHFCESSYIDVDYWMTLPEPPEKE